MLGRKQSIKENVLTDYGEDMLNESADVEWVNKVSHFKYIFNAVFKQTLFNCLCSFGYVGC